MFQRLFSFISLGFFLLILLQLPSDVVNAARAKALASFTPAWNLAHRFAGYVKDRPIFASSYRPTREMAGLELEVEGLRAEREILSAWKGWEEYLKSQIALLGQLKAESYQLFAKRRWEEMHDLVQRQFFAVLAPVIYRDPSSWSSSLWIQVGQKDNESLGRIVVGKNSPVVQGSSLVGVVEFVGREQSRVRLITDPGLSVSVRASRGKTQDRELAHFASSLASRVQKRQDLFLSEAQKTCVIDWLERLQMQNGKEDGYYAKGQLQGSSSSSFRSCSLNLKGVGFNYHYADQEGPSRDLQTGGPIGVDGFKICLLQEGDLLVTSGLDGVFPAGLRVGVVTKIAPCMEGAFSYELEANPTTSNLYDLKEVFVLAPLETSAEHR